MNQRAPGMSNTPWGGKVKAGHRLGATLVLIELIFLQVEESTVSSGATS